MLAIKRDWLEELLIRWGWHFGEEKPAEWDEGDSPAVHPIAVAMAFAPNRVDRSTSIAYKKRRVPIYGDSGAVIGYRQAEPSAGSPSRTACGYTPEAQRRDIDPRLLQVERAAIDLLRVDTTRGLVLRFNYCRRGQQSEKVEWINAEGPHNLNLRAYREHLAHARTWVESRVA